MVSDRVWYRLVYFQSKSSKCLIRNGSDRIWYLIMGQSQSGSANSSMKDSDSLECWNTKRQSSCSFKLWTPNHLFRKRCFGKFHLVYHLFYRLEKVQMSDLQVFGTSKWGLMTIFSSSPRCSTTPNRVVSRILISSANTSLCSSP